VKDKHRTSVSWSFQLSIETEDQLALERDGGHFVRHESVSCAGAGNTSKLVMGGTLVAQEDVIA
jgi:hypothetical protein